MDLIDDATVVDLLTVHLCSFCIYYIHITAVIDVVSIIAYVVYQSSRNVIYGSVATVSLNMI